MYIKNCSISYLWAMAQIEYKDIFKGKPRTLLILESDTDYRIFCENAFVGSLTFADTDGAGRWTTVYNLLKPIAVKLGAHIEQNF